MPCGCFGKPKKGEKEAFQKASPPGGNFKKDPAFSPAVDKQPPPLYRKDPNEFDRRQDVTTTDFKGEECPLLEMQPLGSSHVDSPANDSQAHTPSTIPAASSGNSSGASSPTYPRREGASSRAELAEKRREFFSDLLPPSLHHSSPSTLPTPGRARHSGKGRSGRPLSQPSSDPGERDDAVTPPGPHLLRPTPVSPSQSREGHGFESPEFLLELKTASEEISRRWALPEGELRVREVPGRETSDEERLDWNGQWEAARSVEASYAHPPGGAGPAVATSSGRMDFVSGSASKDSDLVDLGFSEELEDPAEGGASEVVIDVSSPDACSESSSLLGSEGDADGMMIPEEDVVEASLPPTSRIPETLVTPPSPLSGDASPEPPSFGHRSEEEEELDPSALKEISDMGDESFDLSDEAGPRVEGYSAPDEGGRVEGTPLEEGMTQGEQPPHGAPLSAMPIN